MQKTGNVSAYLEADLCKRLDPALKKKLKGTKIVVGGCPGFRDGVRYEHMKGELSLHDGDSVLVDMQAEVISLYDNPKAAEYHLSRKLLAAAESLGDNDSVPVESVSVDSDVLIYGSGLSGLKAGIQLSRNGRTVDIVDTPTETVSPGTFKEVLDSPNLLSTAQRQALERDSIHLLHLDNIREIRKSNGNFHIELKEGHPKRYGSIVFAPERIEPQSAESGSLNLMQAISMVESGQKIKGDVVFLADYGWNSTPDIFQDILATALAFKNRLYAGVWVLCKEIQVANEKQQDLYDACREAGIVFIKYDKKIALQNDYGDFRIDVFDAATGANMDITQPERLIIPQRPELSANAMAFAKKAGIKLDRELFGQPDSQWRLPNKTNRRGIFTAGSARDQLDASQVERDVFSGAYMVRARDGGEDRNVKEHIPVVDTNKCAYCLTCVRVCPFGAMGKDPVEQAASVDAPSCEACGICVAECPAGALEMRNMKGDTIVTGLQTLL